MHNLKLTILTASLMVTSITTKATEDIFTGSFEGTGRACSGKLQVQKNKIKWNSTYSKCKTTQYSVLETDLNNEKKRIAFHLKTPNAKCLYPIIEIKHSSGYNWHVNGYQSLEGFQNKNSPDWKNSPLPERQNLSCLMIKQ